MDDYNDNVTPHPRLLFRKEGFRGNWYTDIEGRDRCGSSWVGPCPYCHSRIPGTQAAERARAQMTEEQRREADAQAARDARRYGEIEDEAQILALEAEAVAAHVAAGAEVSEELLQYVSVYGG